jgi:adenosine/AMP kinase
MDLSIVSIKKPADMNVIIGHSHFIKTVEDLYEAIVQTNPTMKFGLAFCEASGPCLIRSAGNDKELISLAEENASTLAAGHTFVVFMTQGYPLNILNAVKDVPEVCRVYCATANPVQAVIAETDQGRGILGVVDGEKTKGVETEGDVKKRKELLRAIGYKM